MTEDLARALAIVLSTIGSFELVVRSRRKSTLGWLAAAVAVYEGTALKNGNWCEGAMFVLLLLVIGYFYILYEKKHQHE